MTPKATSSFVTGDDSPGDNLKSPADRQGTDVTAEGSSVDGGAETQGSLQQQKQTDVELLAQGIALCKDDQVLPGYRLFQQIQDKSLLTSNDEIKEFYRRGQVSTQLRIDLTAPLEEGWTKQGESHGSRDFITYYRIEDGGKLYCRIESVIEASLYAPLLATINETDLHETWFPRWRIPFKMGLRKSQKLQQAGRVDQVVLLKLDLPFPLNSREIVLHGFADEDCAANRNSATKMVTVDENFAGGVVPPPEKGVARMVLDADFLFRHCPENHPALNKSKGKYPAGESLMLCTFVLFADPKIGFVPKVVQNFCARTVIGTFWRMLVHVAKDVRDGQRPAHTELIESKREELYDWVDACSALISGKVLPDKKEQQK